MKEFIKKYRNILIVDDDDDDRALIAETLHEIDNKLNCVSLTDGRSALTYLVDSENPPDIIFLDLHMPRMNGMELLKILKADAAFAHIPVIICTESKLKREIDECKLLGAVDIIMKPASFILIKYEIRKAMQAISDTLVS